MPGPSRRPPVPVRVLVLTSSREAPPEWADGGTEVTALVVGADPTGRPGPAVRAARTLRRAAVGTRLCATGRASPAAVWHWLRLGVPLDPVRRADVVVSTDPRWDRAAALAADLSAGALVVTAAVAREAAARAGAFREALRQVDGHVQAGPHRTRPGDSAVVGLRDAAAALLAVTPAPLVPVDLVAASARSWVGALAPQEVAELVRDGLGDLPWPEDRAGTAGLAARLEWARQSTDPEPVGDPDLERVRRAAARAAEGSDDAAAAGRLGLALDRWCDAWELLYHRELHTDVPRSPLVDDPRRWLSPLLDTAVHHALVPRPTGPSPRPAQPPGRRPKVMVATGRLGSFHDEVVRALEPVAEVTTVDLSQQFTRLRRRGRPSRDGLQDVAGLRGVVRDSRHRQLAERVRAASEPYDVVFSDWADAATAWLSHTRPDGVRLVVRVHSVDALHPWFPLVDWSAVDEVVVIAPALRSLVLDLLGALGVTDLPVTLLPGLVAVDAIDPGKDDGARQVLGMTGWARRVKDVAWAVDLLELDPAWRLVLVGEPMRPSTGTARARAYTEDTLRRLQRPDLAKRIDVVGWTDDVPAQLRRIGVMLSTSRREGNHHGLVEGAASGAVPVVRNWPVFAARGGARAVYPEEWVVDTVEEAAARIHAVTADDATWQRARMAAREQALAAFDPERAVRMYRATVLGAAAAPSA